MGRGGSSGERRLKSQIGNAGEERIGKELWRGSED